MNICDYSVRDVASDSESKDRPYIFRILVGEYFKNIVLDNDNINSFQCFKNKKKTLFLRYL